MQIEGILFDVDGTLLDSMKIWDTIANDYLDMLGIPTEEDLAQVFWKMTMEESAQYYQKVYHVQKSTEEIIAEINAMIATFYKERVSLKPGVREFLELCAKKNLKMGIETTLDRELVEKSFKRLGVLHYFSRIITCSEVGCGKREEEFFEKAALLFGLPKENVLIVEDALHAIETAKRAGFSVIGVYDASEKRQEEVKALSDYYLSDWTEV